MDENNGSKNMDGYGRQISERYVYKNKYCGLNETVFIEVGK